jgi:hypothetical protein
MVLDADTFFMEVDLHITPVHGEAWVQPTPGQHGCLEYRFACRVSIPVGAASSVVTGPSQSRM